MKKLLSILLAVAMVATTIPFVYAEEKSANVATVKKTNVATNQAVSIITNQTELQAALKAGGNYKLGNNITIASTVYDDGATTVIDLAGYTITGTESWSISVDGGNLTISGGSTENVTYRIHDGKFTIKDMNITAGASSALGCHGGEMILEEVTVNATYGSVVYSTAGTVHIKGGTYSAASNKEMFSSYTGEAPDVRVYGGTFNRDVSEFVADDYAQVEKDGSYVVESNMKGTAGTGVNWIIDCNGKLTISGTGDMVTSWYSSPWKEYNELITSVMIEEGITKISGSAFARAKNLKTISIPSTVNTIGALIVDGCRLLEEIRVNDNNMDYKSVDGILFSEDEKTLVIYPQNKAGKEYDIPDTVTTIDRYAFDECANLDYLIIPDTVKNIGDNAFRGSMMDRIVLGNGIKMIPTYCFDSSNVNSIVIPDSVEEIEYGAFYDAGYLETLLIGSGVKVIAEDVLSYTEILSTVHYKGTQESWDKIVINSDNSEDNGLLTKTIHFISEDSYRDEVEATCKVGHTAGYYCNDCNAYITGEVILAVDNHIDGEPVDENVVGASCTTPGAKDVVTYCTVCSEETSRKTVTSEPFGHKIGDDDKCTVCGNACEQRDVNRDYKCDFCNDEIEIKTVVMDKDYSVFMDDDEFDEYVKFVPDKTGTYVIESNNGGNDYNIDPYVNVYDSNNREIASDDDNDYVDTYNFYCIFRAEKGKTYFIKLGCYDYDVEYEYRISGYQSIEHQPTSKEPWLGLTWDYDAEYQWYTVEMEEITDESAEGRNADGEEKASYSSEEGWKGVKYSNSINETNFFKIELEAGDTINMQISEFVTTLGIWSDYNNECNFYDVEANEICQFTALGDDTYYVYANCSEDARVRAYITEAKEAVEGEDKATLANPTIGTKYVCIATDKTGTYVSNVLTYTYAIMEQPTEGQISVGLNDDTDAKYQWYYVDINNQEITDEDANIVGYGEEDSYYDEDGWHSSLLQLYSGDYSGGVFFGLDLEEGQTITFEFDAHVREFGMVDWNIYEQVIKENFDGGKFTLVAPASGYYEVYYYGEEDFALRAYMNMETYIPIDGATSATYNPDKTGNYACKVTFADSTSEMSKVFEVTHVHAGGTKTCKGYKCDTCGQWYGEADVNVHIDANGDQKCDGCGNEVAKTEDNNVPGNNDDNNVPGNGDNNNPDTGDNRNPWLWIALLAMSVVGISGIAFYEKKRVIISKK